MRDIEEMRMACLGVPLIFFFPFGDKKSSLISLVATP